MRLKPPDGHMDASGVSNQDKTAHILRVSSLRVTWRNLNGLSSIELTRINRNDSHPCILSEPLIKDGTTNPTVTPKFAYLYECSSMKNVFLDVF